jgi:four helix bundle protein
MFLQPTNDSLAIYRQTRFLLVEAYRVTASFPQEEKPALVQQIRRAALSAHLNATEGCNRKSNLEKTRYFDTARRCIVELDTAISIACDLALSDALELDTLGKAIITAFRQLNALVHAASGLRVAAEPEHPYHQGQNGIIKK